MRCINPDRQGNQCIHEMLFSSNPPVHHYEFEAVRIHELTQISIERWASLPIKQRAQAEIASFIALVGAPLEIVEDGAFHPLLEALVDIGRQDRQFHFRRGRCAFTKYRTRKAIIDGSIHLTGRVIAQFAQRPCVSLTIDAGTIKRHHFLD
jgi:hypothetical protein